MKRILVTVDAPKRAPSVLAAAQRLAELVDAKLIVFRAIGIGTTASKVVNHADRNVLIGRTPL